ncbi:hypothetical protein P43SY_006890 [Pythium insidiosum]|uniref:Uncharacterized protein n=1 Tax=Pythium insidiosum TaxID=114742 RepID=A0AAD5Q9N4_PYTIN|nr:hypothetical protein P43SY_006890 [Pythium insidiosum]
MSTIITASKDQKEQLSERERFYRFCRAHITARDEGGYITSQASRLLLNIDLDALERFELVMRSTEYAWEPAWEPVTNIPKSALKKYRDKKRDMRAIRGRSAAIMAHVEKATSTRKTGLASKRK